MNARLRPGDNSGTRAGWCQIGTVTFRPCLAVLVWSWRARSLSAAARFREQAQNFEIEPDEHDHQAEGAVPLHVFWSAHAHAGFDHVEVEDQIERGDDHHEETETD